MNNGVKKAWGYRHVILIIIWFIYLINYFDRISVLTFLPFIQKDLMLTAVQLGWLGSIFFFGYSLAQFLAGYLADRIGPKKTMNIAVWVFTIVTGVTGFVQNFWQFIVLRLSLAVGEGQHFAPSMRMIANWFPRQRKGKGDRILLNHMGCGPCHSSYSCYPTGSRLLRRRLAARILHPGSPGFSVHLVAEEICIRFSEGHV